ncbi:zinc-ribbon domain-containing protein [Streptomyces sp. NPDC059371]|uniref:zinc-ribbon domain-containing protein n=1 Tax=Streptomyces sp. NPDC059371 TaxID=3346812 RepID=UPI0036BB4B4E
MPPRPSTRAVVPAGATLADFPHLAEQLHPDEGPAASIPARSRQPRRWRCGKADDHVWEAPAYRRAAVGAGCPFCAGKYPSETNSLAALCPDVAAELDLEAPATAGLTADQIVAGSHRKVGWRCSTCDHRWVAGVGPRTDRRRAGCPNCAGRVLTPATSLASVRPDIAAQWHPTRNGETRPQDVMPGSATKVWWKCPAGGDHEWAASPSARARAKNPTGCPCCAGYQLSVTNSLASLYPEVAAQLCPERNDGLLPGLVLAGTAQVLWWRCSGGLDHVWEASVVARTKGGNGCPYCANRRTSKTNTLALLPELVAEFDFAKNAPHTPQSLHQSARQKVWWRCPMGPDHRWCTTVANRARTGHGCPFCLNQHVSVTNSLATLFPQIATELDPALNGGRTAHHYVATSSTTATWHCAFGHTWTLPVVARTRAAANGGGGCPDCYPTRTSLRQLALASALAHALPNLTVDSRPAPVRGLDGQTREPDITIPALRLALEYDGSFYHRGRDTHDAAKSQALRAVGWQVVRLRETPLVPTHDHDLVVPILPAAQADTLVPDLLTHLLTFLDAPGRAVLAVEIGAARTVERPAWQWTGPPPRFQEQLQALRTFAGREGHGRPASTHWEGDCALGGWVMEQRRLYRAGKLPPVQIQLLEAVPGWVWVWSAFRWQMFTDALASFVARTGHARAPYGHMEDGYPLGVKVASIRADHQQGKLPATRVAELEARPGWKWRPERIEQAAEHVDLRLF